MPNLNAEMRQGAEAGMDALHNMSAPPRTRISIRPLHPQKPEADSQAPKGGSETNSDTGLQRFTTIAVDRLIQRWFPAFRVKRGDLSCVRWGDRARLTGRAENTEHLRLRCLIAISQLATGELLEINRRQVYALVGHTLEALEELFMDNIARLDPVALGLPPFALARPLGPGNISFRRLRVELNPARALALLSRTGGKVYSAGRTPVLPDTDRFIPPFALYTNAPEKEIAVFSFGEESHD